MKRLSSLIFVVVSLFGGLNHSISRVNAQYYDCTVSCSAFAPETAEVGKRFNSPSPRHPITAMDSRLICGHSAMVRPPRSRVRVSPISHSGHLVGV
jgi:hypothetical protein